MMRRWIHHFWFRLHFELKRYEKEILQNRLREMISYVDGLMVLDRIRRQTK